MDASSLVQKLKKSRSFLCSVESCTGGMIASAITDIPGASEVFWGALIVYDNQAKRSLLDVPDEILKKQGAVSHEVAEILASQGLLTMKKSIQKYESNPINLICVSTTGIAGPTGGTPDKPVGLCYLGLAQTQNTVVSKKIQSPLHNNRNQNRSFFVSEAIKLISQYLPN